jgi:N-methylhydantoinase B
VLADVLDGFVSTESARELYGVVVAGAVVDAEATRALRARLGGAGSDWPDFDLGPERRAYEMRWTDALQDAVNAAAWAQPAGVRTVIRELLQQELGRRLEAGEVVAPADVPVLAAKIVASLRARLYS